MGKLKLGILGNGYLADIIVEAGLKGMLDEYELVGVLGRTREKTELLAKKGGCRACSTIDELLELENPYACPHGRPTIISMSRYELEKKFKRIV